MLDYFAYMNGGYPYVVVWMWAILIPLYILINCLIITKQWIKREGLFYLRFTLIE